MDCPVARSWFEEARTAAERDAEERIADAESKAAAAIKPDPKCPHCFGLGKTVQGMPSKAVAIAAGLFTFAMPTLASRFIASALVTPGVLVPCPVCMVRK